MRFLAIITALLVALTQPIAAQSFKPDYDAGFKAYTQNDYATALKHFRPLAKQGDVDAQYNLGRMYLDGHGVPRDDKEAAHWYRMAAKQGEPYSQWWLGRMYRDGHGVVQDLVMAYVWMNVAVANGKWSSHTHDRDKALAKLNTSERKLARMLSKLCLKKPASCPAYSDD